MRIERISGAILILLSGVLLLMAAYANEGARTKIDELKKVKFSKRSNKAAQGDKSLTVDVDMMIVGGVYQDGVAPV